MSDRNCNNCLHATKLFSDHPCNDCHEGLGLSKWEEWRNPTPKVIPIAAAVDTGGAAFPTSFSKDYPTEMVGGMTLRDAFAKAAMQGMVASPHCPKVFEEDLLADAAYTVADAMLKRREKP